MFIKPKDDQTVIRNPHTLQPLPMEGAEVDDNDFYYLSRISDGDVILVSRFSVSAG